MSDRYYYCTDGKTPIGPVDPRTLQTLYDSGIIGWHTPVLKEGDEDGWLEAAAYVDVASASTRSLQPPPVSVGPVRKKKGLLNNGVFKGCLIWAIATPLALCLMAYCATKMSEIDYSTPSIPEWQTNYYNARATIQTILKAPSQATFSLPGDGETGASELGNGIWEASGTVDAPNSFGVKLRHKWRLVWYPKSGFILYSKIGDQTAGDLKAALALAKAAPTPAATRMPTPRGSHSAL